MKDITLLLVLISIAILQMSTNAADTISVEGALKAFETVYLKSLKLDAKPSVSTIQPGGKISITASIQNQLPAPIAFVTGSTEQPFFLDIKAGDHSIKIPKKVAKVFVDGGASAPRRNQVIPLAANGNRQFQIPLEELDVLPTDKWPSGLYTFQLTMPIVTKVATDGAFKVEFLKSDPFNITIEK